MSGHSKWATTKRHKAAVDAKRGKIFSVISKEITLAVRDGGKDSEMNPRLRTMILKAKATNMPNDNIDRAIKKGTGELGGDTIEELLYEGYGPGGVGIIVEVTTDNKNRSASEIRSTFSKGGGNLAGAGALAYNFQKKGQFWIPLEDVDGDQLMEVVLEAGADDIISHKDQFEILTDIASYYPVSQALSDANIPLESSEMVYIPNTLTPVNDTDTAKSILRLIDKLDDLEDVKNVHSNFDIDDSLLSEF
jgi:YebC/PmpR family DNA-binding regulatory protein|tara:strand:- start:2233 stop:2979 length:747 start_codon:yes stop_codon:yes gene_type:complete